MHLLAGRCVCLSILPSRMSGRCIAMADNMQLVLQAAVRYGVAMLKRTGGGLRPHVQVDNAYERRLLAGAKVKTCFVLRY